MVVSHDCSIDKTKRNCRVLIAPVHPMPGDAGLVEVIRSQQDFGLMPLGDLPGTGESYADLRCITFIDKRLIDPSRRLASLSDLEREHLHVQIVAFFVDRDLPIAKAPQKPPVS
jgi:hypothetical protein